MDNEISSETLTAFLDGELPPEEAQRVAAILAKRPDLDAWVRRQDRLRTALRDSFSGVMAAPPPERLLRAAHQAPASRRWLIGRALAGWKMQIWAPAGAALAAGVIIGLLAQPSALLVNRDGQIMADGSLAQALDHRLASAGYDGSGTRIGISFRGHDGHDCRTFDRDYQAGLACRQANGWAIAILESHPKNAGGAYRMAGSEMPDSVRQAVMARIEGVPFNAAAEKAARDSGWK